MPVSGLIPIVFWANNFDPIERGYVKSLARPGGNLTGVFTRQPELADLPGADPPGRIMGRGDR